MQDVDRVSSSVNYMCKHILLRLVHIKESSVFFLSLLHSINNRIDHQTEYWSEAGSLVLISLSDRSRSKENIDCIGILFRHSSRKIMEKENIDKCTERKTRTTRKFFRTSPMISRRSVYKLYVRTCRRCVFRLSCTSEMFHFPIQSTNESLSMYSFVVCLHIAKNVIYDHNSD